MARVTDGVSRHRRFPRTVEVDGDQGMVGRQSGHAIPNGVDEVSSDAERRTRKDGNGSQEAWVERRSENRRSVGAFEAKRKRGEGYTLDIGRRTPSPVHGDLQLQ